MVTSRYSVVKWNQIWLFCSGKTAISYPIPPNRGIQPNESKMDFSILGKMAVRFVRPTPPHTQGKWPNGSKMDFYVSGKTVICFTPHLHPPLPPPPPPPMRVVKFDQNFFLEHYALPHRSIFCERPTIIFFMLTTLEVTLLVSKKVFPTNRKMCTLKYTLKPL